jgi:TolB-like protein
MENLQISARSLRKCGQNSNLALPLERLQVRTNPRTHDTSDDRSNHEIHPARNDFVHTEAKEKSLFPGKSEGKEKISEEAIRDELSRILQSSMFFQSDRLCRFLRFTVERTLKGEGDTVKEYLIGTEVYDRPTSYHPSEDSIVRSEARRLRNKLREYYDSVGGSDRVTIYYRPGSYVPVFRSQPKHGLKIAARAPAAREHLTGGNGIPVAVLPFSDGSGSKSAGVYAQLITDELIHELVRTDGVRVTAASSVAPLVAKAMDVRSLARKLNVEIVFEGAVCQENNLLRVTSRVVNPADGFQIWSERIDTEPDLKGLSTVAQRIASSLVSRIRPSNG